MSKRKYNLALVLNAVVCSHSIRELLGKLGIVRAGGNYLTIKNYLDNNNIDYSHFTGKGWNKRLKFKPK